MTYFLYYLDKRNEIKRMSLETYESEAFNTLAMYTDVGIQEILYIEDVPEVCDSIRNINMMLYSIEKRLKLIR